MSCVSVPGLIRLVFAIGVFYLFFGECYCNTCSVVNINYSRSSSCIGQAGTDFILNTLNNVAPVECGDACDEMAKCLVFFFNRESRTCKLHSRPLGDITTISEDNTICYISIYAAESWVDAVVDVSGSTVGFSHPHIIGEPNSAPWGQPAVNQEDFIEVLVSLSGSNEAGVQCGTVVFYNEPTANSFNDTFEVVISTVSIPSAMYIEQMLIHEMVTGGGVIRISLLAPNGTWYPVWSTSTVQYNGGSPIMSPDLAPASFNASRILINVGSRTAKEFIDAVRFIGRLTPRP